MGTVWRAPWREVEQAPHGGGGVRVDRWEVAGPGLLASHGQQPGRTGHSGAASLGPQVEAREEGHSAGAVDPESKQGWMGRGTGQSWGGGGCFLEACGAQHRWGAPLQGTAWG